LSLKYIAEEVGRIKGVSLKEITEKTEDNARALFGEIA
jgi:Tat protein secretion system quality control protein TatD with DNase activity